MAIYKNRNWRISELIPAATEALERVKEDFAAENVSERGLEEFYRKNREEHL